jgi:hypothetical protein
MVLEILKDLPDFWQVLDRVSIGDILKEKQHTRAIEVPPSTSVLGKIDIIIHMLIYFIDVLKEMKKENVRCALVTHSTLQISTKRAILYWRFHANSVADDDRHLPQSWHGIFNTISM